MKLLQLAGSIHEVFQVWLLELYIFDRSMAPKPPPPIEIDGEVKYELEEILQSEYRYGNFHYCVKYKGYSV